MVKGYVLSEGDRAAVRRVVAKVGDTPLSGAALKSRHRPEADAADAADVADAETVLCKVTGQSGIGYSVDFYANGRESPSTGSGVLFATELALVGTLPEGSWILGHKTAVQITGGGES